jgi:Zn-dependent protease
MELRLGSIPVRVQGWFIMMALLLGSNERNPALLALWVAVVVVSVVIHELGHALVGKAFGLVPSIELHGMGGTTSFERDPKRPSRSELGTLRSIAISLAGPFAGFLFALVVMLAQSAGLHPAHPVAQYAIRLLFAVNIGWGIFNLLPMLPLDGGNVLRHALVAATKDRGEAIARVVSIVIAAGIALYALQGKQWWILYLGVLFAFRNVQALRDARR